MSRDRSHRIPIRANWHGLHVWLPPHRGLAVGSGAGNHNADPAGDLSFRPAPMRFPLEDPTVPDDTPASSSFQSSASSSSACQQIGDCDHANQYTFTVAGVTATGCSAAFCAAWNRTWTVTWVSGNVWREDLASGLSCSPFGTFNGHRAEVLQGTGGIAILTRLVFYRQFFSAGLWESMAEYWSTDCDFDCEGSTVFSFQGASANTCTTWPATITVSKV